MSTTEPDIKTVISPSESRVVLVSIAGLPEPLSYLYTPQEHQKNQPQADNTIAFADRVTVDVRKRIAQGWVIEVLSQDAAKAQQERFTLKPIISKETLLTRELSNLALWMVEYYGCSLVDVLDNICPSAPILQDKKEAVFSLSRQLFEDSEFRDKTLSRLEARSISQFHILNLLVSAGEEHKTKSEISQVPDYSSTALRALEKKNLIERQEISSQIEHTAPHFNIGASNHSQQTKDYELNADQQNAAGEITSAVHASQFSPFLLFGVTGSGKTEVYLQAVNTALSLGKSALLIVPEISLTPQLLERVSMSVNQPVAVLHSNISNKERSWAWQQCLSGKLRVALGARSAVFAPLQNLGVILVDEEHDGSFKQSDGFRYSAHSAAIMRAKLNECPIVFGSATPSFESLLNSKRGKYKLLELPKRVAGRPLPQIEVVDLRSIKRKDMPSPNISPMLEQALKEILAKNQQAMLLYNRRGFSSFLQCSSCGSALSCPSCSVSLTFYKNTNKLLCHYCGHTLSPPTGCPICLDPRTTEIDCTSDTSSKSKIGELIACGSGTEKVVEEIAQLFPSARILQMDRTTVSKKHSHERILNAMKNAEADILVGTQMIAKGHDIPNVTLVGIVNADVGLHLPDFRANERVYQLIAQASGRSGRGVEPGRVIVQTREPKHPVILSLLQNKFGAFVRYELEHRKTLHYPPWHYLLRIVISSTDGSRAEIAAAKVKKLIEGKSRELTADDNRHSVFILGPAPAPLEKLRGQIRHHILVKANSRKLLSALSGEIYQFRIGLGAKSKVRISLDLDPIDML